MVLRLTSAQVFHQGTEKGYHTEEIREMSCMIQQACQFASGLSGANPCELWRQIYLTQNA